PFTIEFTVRGYLPTRYAEIARFLDLPAGDEPQAAASLAAAIRDLAGRIGQPTSLRGAGISPEQFEANLEPLIDKAFNDSAMTVTARFPEEEELEQVLRCLYDGRSVDC
ncbi:MAG: iron-containing alcohol dehydrogenase, partial [Anaerolineae bacterium]